MRERKKREAETRKESIREKGGFDKLERRSRYRRNRSTVLLSHKDRLIREANW